MIWYKCTALGRNGPCWNGRKRADILLPPVRNTKLPEARSALIGYQEASLLTGIPVNTLKDYRAKGKGPLSAVIGGRVKYRHADVLAWVDGQFDRSAKGASVMRPVFEPLNGRALGRSA